MGEFTCIWYIAFEGTGPMSRCFVLVSRRSLESSCRILFGALVASAETTSTRDMGHEEALCLVRTNSRCLSASLIDVLACDGLEKLSSAAVARWLGLVRQVLMYSAMRSIFEDKNRQEDLFFKGPGQDLEVGMALAGVPRRSFLCSASRYVDEARARVQAGGVAIELSLTAPIIVDEALVVAMAERQQRVPLVAGSSKASTCLLHVHSLL